MTHLNDSRNLYFLLLDVLDTNELDQWRGETVSRQSMFTFSLHIGCDNGMSPSCFAPETSFPGQIWARYEWGCFSDGLCNYFYVVPSLLSLLFMCWGTDQSHRGCSMVPDDVARCVVDSGGFSRNCTGRERSMWAYHGERRSKSFDWRRSGI